MAFVQRTSRELRRLGTINSSHMFSKIQEGVSGVPSVRAYGQETNFMEAAYKAIDLMDDSLILKTASEGWLITWLNNVNILLIFITGILVMLPKSGINPSLAGVVLASSINSMEVTRKLAKAYSDVEVMLHAMERVYYYCTSIPHEAPLQTDLPLHANWPQNGMLKFESVDLRYRPELPLVLRNFSLDIKGGEKVGVVGRTGAGKSSLIVALFRIVELSAGKISIDGVNLAGVGLETLRSRLSIIPQDPLLFEGDVRKNLDPFGKRSDDELLKALCEVNLTKANPGNSQEIVSYEGVQLSDPVQIDGENFSLGQRQQLSLSRALLNHSNVVILDEATSNIDLKVDAEIQKNMMRLLANRTVISIAHRLRSVLGFDKIVVLDQGQVAEAGSPRELFDKGGIFTEMCRRSGIKGEDIDMAALR